MATKRRSNDVFNLSFLDCICCGFGAIVLLFVMSRMGSNTVIEASPEDLSGLVAELEEQLHEIRGDTAIFNRDLTGKKEQLSENKERLARLQGDLSDIKGQFAASKQHSEVQNKLEGSLQQAQQRLTEEMKRLYANRPPVPPKSDQPIGGIPVDSEYIIFIIDTSGSMKGYAWPLVQTKMEEVLNIYPKVKGIQVMNDMGDYMFPTYAGKWIPDSPSRRTAIMKRLATWAPFSNSSPVEGIRTAIRSYYAPDKKISLYVLGDEFMGGSAQSVVDEVDRLNRPRNGSSERLVRIHAIGFPVQFQGSSTMSGVRFAMLMRALCERNNGTFVGLNSIR